MSSKDLINKSTDDFMTYAAAVIKSRAIPSVEDNLKPVNRRILYTLKLKKLFSSAKVLKVANVVGATMVYHPHGDASIYEALVRLSQPWKMRYPLVYVHGNNGSVGGDPAAAARYIECKLTEIGDEMLENTEEEIVPFVANYDDTSTEPTVLGGMFPNILCNGTEGIAVGMSCGLVPHNLNEACDLLIATAEGKVNNVDDAMRYLSGPDFPLGGIIIDGYKLHDIYATGQGSITLRAKSEIKGNRITFSEFPYNVEVENSILTAIKKLKIEEGYDDIEDVENHMGKETCNIVVVLRKTANAQKVLSDLYDKTPLEKVIKINQTVIYNGVPHLMNLNEICAYFLHHQHTIFINKAKLAKDKADHIIHINEGLKKASLDIDNVVKIVRESSSKDEAAEKLIKILAIDDEQAKAILALQLGRLTKLDQHDIEQKIADAKADDAEQTKIIEDVDYRTSLICKGLADIKKRFGDPRRTLIVADKPSPTTHEIDPNTYCIMFGDGTVVNEASAHLEEDFKTGGQFAKTPIRQVLYSGGDRVLVLQADGTTAESSSMTDRDTLFRCQPHKKFVITISRNGIMKKSDMSEYKSFVRLCKQKKDDEVLYGFCVDDSDAIAVLQSSGKIRLVKVSSIKTTTKLTIGTHQTDEVKMACVVMPIMFTLSADGHVKRFDAKELEEGNNTINDDVAAIGDASTANGYYYNGHFVSFLWASVALKGKTAVGAKLTNKPIQFIV
jgi:DNA gyrase/topoisomerase IV subunit A